MTRLLRCPVPASLPPAREGGGRGSDRACGLQRHHRRRALANALLRARAIENGAYVLAPAQTGTHAAHNGRPRRTYGHSLAVSPWGEVLVDARHRRPGSAMSISSRRGIAKARARVPSLMHDRDYRGAMSMSDQNDPLAVALFSEVFMADQLGAQPHQPGPAEGDGAQPFLGPEPSRACERRTLARAAGRRLPRHPRGDDQHAGQARMGGACPYPPRLGRCAAQVRLDQPGGTRGARCGPGGDHAR